MSKSLVVDWNQDQEEDINLRDRFIFTCIDDWLKKQSKKVVNKPSSKMISFSKPSSSNTQLLSLVAGSVLSQGK